MGVISILGISPAKNFAVVWPYKDESYIYI